MHKAPNDRPLLPDGVTARVSSAWYSPSYGVRIPCAAIDLEADVALDGLRTWAFSFSDAARGDGSTDDDAAFVTALTS